MASKVISSIARLACSVFLAASVASACVPPAFKTACSASVTACIPEVCTWPNNP